MHTNQDTYIVFLMFEFLWLINFSQRWMLSRWSNGSKYTTELVPLLSQPFFNRLFLWYQICMHHIEWERLIDLSVAVSDQFGNKCAYLMKFDVAGATNSQFYSGYDPHIQQSHHSLWSVAFGFHIILFVFENVRFKHNLYLIRFVNCSIGDCEQLSLLFIERTPSVHQFNDIILL